MTITYQFPLYPRLEPRTPWQGGRVTHTDVLTLSDAAAMATAHAGETVTVGDFLRAAGRGEITLRAIVHHTAKLQKHDGGIYCNRGQETENTAPAGAILTLPLVACEQLAAAGRASWRTFDGFNTDDGLLMRYTIARLVAGEPDFETVPDDCRVTGDAVHALADEFKGKPQAVPVGEAGLTPWHLLATPTDLIDAFGKFTGMDKAWFNNVKDTPGLKAALHTAGQGGRNGREPLYYVMPVMQWLADPKRRKGRPMGEAAGWRVLGHKFPKVHEEYLGQKPDTE
jgi:hypothetical protein